MYATGGTITTDGLYRIHTFSTVGSDTLEVISGGTADILVVAGGGGGGGCVPTIFLPRYYGGGGGGAGGYRYFSSYTVSSGPYPITVGAGGIKGTSVSSGGNGGDSIFDTITSTGGGGGSTLNNTSGNNGGSGGGHLGLGNTPATSPSQGNNGGGAAPIARGGGGGIGGAGSYGTPGIGVNNSISGISVGYAGGGGGGSTYVSGYDNPPFTATHGGGNGGGSGSYSQVPGNGINGTGGGGGGAGGGVSSLDGGSGGSGIVIVRYLVTAPTVTTEAVQNLGPTSVSLVGTLENPGDAGFPVTVGFEYGITPSLGSTSDTYSTGSFGTISVNLNGLDRNTTYYYRAFATSSSSTGYGEILSFTTLNIVLPTVYTGYGDVTNNTVNIVNEIYDTGGENCTVRGMEYGLTDSYGTTIEETGSFSAGQWWTNLTNLKPWTTYHFRAYATNSIGKEYGPDNIFLTQSCKRPIAMFRPDVA